MNSTSVFSKIRMQVIEQYISRTDIYFMKVYFFHVKRFLKVCMGNSVAALTGKMIYKFRKGKLLFSYLGATDELLERRHIAPIGFSKFIHLF